MLQSLGQYGLGGLALYIIWQLHKKELRALIEEQRKTNRYLRAFFIAVGRADLLAQEDK